MVVFRLGDVLQGEGTTRCYHMGAHLALMMGMCCIDGMSRETFRAIIGTVSAHIRNVGGDAAHADFTTGFDDFRRTVDGKGKIELPDDIEF